MPRKTEILSFEADCCRCGIRRSTILIIAALSMSLSTGRNHVMHAKHRVAFLQMETTWAVLGDHRRSVA